MRGGKFKKLCSFPYLVIWNVNTVNKFTKLVIRRTILCMMPVLYLRVHNIWFF